MRSSILRVCLLSLAILVPVQAFGQDRSIALSRTNFYVDPYLEPFVSSTYDSALVMTSSYVLVRGYQPLRSVWFALPASECMTLLSITTSSPYNVEGSIETGVTIDFGQCLDPPFIAMTVSVVFWMPSDTCCAWVFEPHADEASLRVKGTDCNGDTVLVEPEGGTFNYSWESPIAGCGAPSVPKYPFPPDGAVDQPLDVTLDWFTQTTAGTNLGVFMANIYFGATPTPPVHIWNVDAWLPQTVGPLEPSTTYYWKVRSIATDFGWVDGPMWSFTTSDGVAAEAKTWSQIKAMMKKKE